MDFDVVLDDDPVLGCDHKSDDCKPYVRKYDGGNLSLLCAKCRYIIGWWEPIGNGDYRHVLDF